MRLGVIAGKGGSALAAAFECLKNAGKQIDLFVVVDKDCGAYNWAKTQGVPVMKINYENCDIFSFKASEYFICNKVENILLSYTKRVGKPLIDELQVSNIHPALLPSFRGLHGVEDALSEGVRILGATLHGVDEGLDTGPIIAQISTGLSFDVTLERANKISFLQKTYLILMWYELINDFGLSIDSASRFVSFKRKPMTGISASPVLKNDFLIREFDLLQKKENCYVM